MVVQHEIDKILKLLYSGKSIQLNVGDSTIVIQIIDENSKIVLSTQVYYGGNFIPGSVRRCVQKINPKRRHHLRTTLTIDEANFQIFLTYRGLNMGLNPEIFSELLEDFSRQADEWRLYLDENDKNDLIYVRTK